MSKSTTVRGLDGETFNIQHAPGASLSEIKRLIAEKTGIDPVHQHISRGGRTLVDDDSSHADSSAAQHKANDQLAASLERCLSSRSTMGFAAERLGTGCLTRSRPCGLVNIGGTSCYLNAALQVLLAVDQLAEPSFYRSFLQRDGSGQEARRWRLANAIAAFVADVSTTKEATATASQDDGDRPQRSQSPVYLHALLSHGVTGLSGAERFQNGAPADCAECWDLLLRALDNTAECSKLPTRNATLPTRQVGVRELFCGQWGTIANGRAHHSDGGTDTAFWSLTLLRAGSIDHCLAANGIHPLPAVCVSESHGSPSASTSLDHWASDSTRIGNARTKVDDMNADACYYIRVLPEYVVFQFKTDPARQRQLEVTFPIEGLDLSKYSPKPPPKRHNSEIHGQATKDASEEQATLAPALYDLVAAVYYHPSHGSTQAIDGELLSGLMHQSRSSLQRLHRHKRRRCAHSNTGPCPKQAGHYTAAVFRPTETGQHMPRTGVDGLSTSRGTKCEQERTGSWWVCDDEEVRLLQNPQQLVANEVQMLMYRRREVFDANASLETVNKSGSASTFPVIRKDRQRQILTRTRVKFGEDGSIVQTTRELVGARDRF